MEASRGTPNTPQNRAAERYSGDLMFKEIVFVYRASLKKDGAGSSYESWATVAEPIPASVQVIGADSQQTDPTKKPLRYARISTRVRNGIAWHDKVVFRDITMLAVKIEDKFNNDGGEFCFSTIKAFLLNDKDSVSISGIGSGIPGVSGTGNAEAWIFRSHVVPQSAHREFDSEGRLLRITTADGTRTVTRNGDGTIASVIGTGAYKSMYAIYQNNILVDIQVS